MFRRRRTRRAEAAARDPEVHVLSVVQDDVRTAGETAEDRERRRGGSCGGSSPRR